MIKKCECKHPYQDRKYGKGRRVMNKCASKINAFYRCTVCLKEHTSGGDNK